MPARLVHFHNRKGPNEALAPLAGEVSIAISAPRP